MSLDDSPPWVKQRTEESICWWRHCMQLRQVLLERNLLRADMRNPVLLPIGQMLLENQWEYLFYDRGPCSTSLRSSFPSWWWSPQHLLLAWFLWHETIERGQVPFKDQYRCFCSNALVLSKGCCNQPLASSSSEWAYSQEGHPSLCHCDANSLLLVQVHLPHYARGSRWEEHESVFWVFDHSNLCSGRDRYFRLWAKITDSRSSWLSDPHEAYA
jgi:hypothetical protein